MPASVAELAPSNLCHFGHSLSPMAIFAPATTVECHYVGMGTDSTAGSTLPLPKRLITLIDLGLGPLSWVGRELDFQANTQRNCCRRPSRV